jgi:hypothetical protein
MVVRFRDWLSLCVAVLVALSPLPSLAQSAVLPVTSQSLLVQEEAGLYLTWPGAVTAATAIEQLPKVRFQGYELPMRLLTVQVDGAGALADGVQINELAAVDWSAPLTPAAPPAPPALDWQPTAEMTPVEAVALPTAPVFVLRQGWVRDQHIAVIAISPFYQEQGQPKLATHLAAHLPRAQAVSEPLTASDDVLAAARHSTTTAHSLLPINPAATARAYKLIVSQPGLQQVTGQMLAAAGLDLATVNPANLHLMYDGQPIALHLTGLSADRLTPTSTLTFYAPKVGDRWNVTSLYWLTVETTPGIQMTTRAVTPAEAPARVTVVEQGEWRNYRRYESTQAGFDGDHWFSYLLKAGGADASEGQSTTLPLGNRLPPTAGSTTLTVTFSTATKADHRVRIALGDRRSDVAWHSAPQGSLIRNWQQTVELPTGPTQAVLELVSTELSAGVLVDHIHWRQPALLDLRNSSALFSGEPGLWRYQWQNAPQQSGSYRLYDVTNPNAPVILTGATAAGFQDGPTAHSYLLVGPDFQHTPTVMRHDPVVFTEATGATALYIAPAGFIATLEPLLAHRRSQGYTVLAVDVQTIYDAWSYGQVSAEAIRTFLRFAAATWQPTPQAVVLVGDGTWDPHNYEGRAHFTNYIPPYVAPVDPWLGEAACDTCYAQLDGDDPLTGDRSNPDTPFFATDLWLGRFPVRDTQELNLLVNKIIRYENDTTPAAWRSISIFLADNNIQRLDNRGNPVLDPAGDFGRLSDLMVRRQLCAVVNDPVLCDLSGPNSDLEVNDQVLADQTTHLSQNAPLQIARYYYDPYPTFADPDGRQHWRLTGAAETKAATLAALNQGAGLVTYTGHAHHWQWARFDTDPSVDGFVSLFEPDGLINRDQLFIALSMTCLTAQFHKPADSGTVLDERMLLSPNGGAVAVWGPAGLSVVHGHDALQRGFHAALWAAPPLTAPLGHLIEAGHTELLTTAGCCQDALQTFLLLGDPLTPARVMPVNGIYMPEIVR